MTRASQSSRTVTEHRFTVPCEGPYGGDWADFGTARTWATKKAEELGINTDAANWSRLHVEDDKIVIVVIEESKENFSR